MNRTVRYICLLLALCMLVSITPGLRLQASAYASAKPLPELTGNKGQDVANIAISQLGYAEDSSGTVYGAWWAGVTGSSIFTKAGWCAMFAMWCAHHAGAGMGIAYDTRGAQPAKLMSWLLTNASGDTSFSVAPAPGEFIFFSTGSSAQHVAIVVAYDKASNKVTFVGGNQSNKVTQFTMTYNSTAKYGSQRIIGIGRPNYGTSVIVPSCSCSESYAGYYQCITQSDPLNMRGGHGTGYAVVGSIPSGATVYVSKAQGVSNSSWAHVEYNGIKGYCSMQYLKRLLEYDVEVVYDEHTGNVTGANIEIYDHVSVDEMTLTLPEQLVVGPGETSAPIQVSAKDGFLLNLEIPLAGDFSRIKPVIIDAIGQAIDLEEYSLTENGILVSVAGTVELRLINQAQAHTHEYTAQVTTQPTCEAAGETTYTCACGHSYTEAIDALGHSYSATVVAPSCTEDGYTLHTCAACGSSYTDAPTQAEGHSYTSQVTKAPGCEAAGETTYTCPCGHSYTEAMDALGHSYSAVVTAPACTSGGYTTYTCSACGDAYVDDFTEQTGHSFQNGVCASCGEADADYVPFTGLQKAEDGNYYYYVDGNIAAEFTGLVANSAGRWYVLGGQVQMNYDGLIEFEGTKYLIKAGHVNTAFTGITKQQGVYYYFTQGVNDLEYEGLVLCNGMKAYVSGGEVDFNKTAIVDDNGTLCFVKYGIWRNTFKGLVRDGSGEWLYMENGVFVPSYTGVAKLNDSWVYVADGYVSFKFSGTVQVDGVDYTVRYGFVQF